MEENNILKEDEIEEIERQLASPMNVDEEDPETPDEPEPEPDEEEIPEPEPEPDPEIPEEPEDNTNNRRKKIMKYGLKEVADVIFFDIRTRKPVLVFDTYSDAI